METWQSDAQRYEQRAELRRRLLRAQSDARSILYRNANRRRSWVSRKLACLESWRAFRAAPGSFLCRLRQA